MTKNLRRKDFPCVLCEKPTRDWDRICWTCRNDHELGVRTREARERKDIEAHIELVPIIWYWKFFFPRDGKRMDRGAVMSRLRDAVVWIADGELVAKYGGIKRFYGNQTQVGNSPYDKDFDTSYDIYEFKRRGTWKHLLDLCRATTDFGRYCYIEGFENGSRLLSRLADGEVSVEEYNDRMARRVSG